MNTKKTAQELYKKLKKEEKNIYHLSTNMYPKHRKRVLKMIREQLDKNETCIVISTSLVEAGVDLDFDIVYRQIAGVDSIIQAAGRCNRNGKKDVAKSKVYIFDLIDEKR
ncbi:MAG: helicase-related protein [Ruminococcus sp.]